MELLYPGSGLITGIMFGGTMSLILSTIHIVSTKKISFPQDQSDTSVKQTLSLDLNLSYDKAFKICLSSVDAIKRCEVTHQNYNDGIIESKAGITWKTWGDHIRFSIQKINLLKTHIEVTSKLSVSTTIVDYGKNRQNIETVV